MITVPFFRDATRRRLGELIQQPASQPRSPPKTGAIDVTRRADDRMRDERVKRGNGSTTSWNIDDAPFGPSPMLARRARRSPRVGRDGTSTR
jgi:hypothetical protein